MNNQEWRETAKMNATKRLALALASLFALGTCLPTQAAFLIQGGSNQGLPIGANSFNTEITTLGFDQMASGAQLQISQNGYIDFYYIGAESGFNNSFTATGAAMGGNNTGFLTEHNESFDFSGYAGFTIAVTAGDILDFSFTSDNANALKPVDNFSGTNPHGLGIYFDSSESASLQQVILGYDDQLYNDDDDFEDMLVRADFRFALPPPSAITTVPLPGAAWLFLAGLTGLAGFMRKTSAPRD
jgi:hypothetical protein